MRHDLRPMGSIPASGAATMARHRLHLRLPTLERMLAYVVVLLFAGLYLFPLLYLVNVSLKTSQSFLLDPASLAGSLHLDNYRTAWQEGNFPRYIVNSLLYTIASTLLHTLLALFVGFPIARNYVRWSNVFYLFFLAGLFLPSALIPQFQLMLKLGLYNTQIGYILLTAGVGIAVFLVVSFTKSIPRDLDEAAVMDGCSYARFVLTIILPLTKPALVTVALLHGITVWNDIIGPTIYFSNDEYYPITRGLFAFYGQYGNNWPPLAAAIIIVALPLIGCYIFAQRYFIEGAISGAVKG